MYKGCEKAVLHQTIRMNREKQLIHVLKNPDLFQGVGLC